MDIYLMVGMTLKQAATRLQPKLYLPSLSLYMLDGLNVTMPQVLLNLLVKILQYALFVAVQSMLPVRIHLFGNMMQINTGKNVILVAIL